MGLINLLSLKKESEPIVEHYFALELNNEVIKAAVWVVKDGRVEVKATSDSISLDTTDADTLLHAVDMALATVSQESTSEPTRVIFGLPENWVDNQGIVPDKRGVLKQICTKLELQPLGYVVTLEALINALQQEQGTPPTALFIRFSQDGLLITLVQLGKIIAQERVGRSGEVVADVEEGLMRFKQFDQLPARMLLYDTHSDFEDIKQQLLGVDWEKDFPFLHTPQIDCLPSEITIKAVAVSGGMEAAKSLGMAMVDPQPSNTGDESVTPSALPVSEKILPEVVPQEEIDTSVSQVKDLPEGFSVGSDIPSPQTLEMEETALPQDLEPQANQQLVSNSPEAEADTVQGSLLESNQQTIHPLLKVIILPLAHIGDKVHAVFTKLAVRKETLSDTELPLDDTPISDVPAELPETSQEIDDAVFETEEQRKTPWLLISMGILLVIGALAAGGFWFYWNKPQATIVLALAPQQIDKEFEVTVATSATQTDKTLNIIPGVVKEVSLKGSETIPTTGTKRIGEKAAGEVTLYNKTSKSKTFATGTVLVGPNNLRFVLSESVTVASSSAQTTDSGRQITFGKADGKVAAGDIGEEYNVKEGSTYTLKDYPEDQFSAKAKITFTGGKSTEQRAVSKEDQKAALEAVIKKLEAEAQSKIQNETSGGTIVFSSSQESDVVDQSFDNKVGVESQTVTAEAELKIKVLTAAKTDVDNLALGAINSNLPQNFLISNNVVTTEIGETKKTADDTKVIIKAKAKLMPKLNFSELKTNIIGKSPEIVEQYFRTMPNYVRTKITINPALPGKLATLPHKPENIAITVEEAQ